MKYTTFNVQQLANRKGKPWQARAKYKDVYGKWKETSKMLPEAKGKKEAMRMAREWFDELNAQADLMPNTGKAKTVDEVYKEYLQHQVSTGEIERSTYSNSLYSYTGLPPTPVWICAGRSGQGNNRWRICQGSFPWRNRAWNGFTRI